MHPSLSRLHQLRPADPLVRWLVDPEKDDLSLGDQLLHDGANVAWRGRATRPGENWVTGLGEDPERVAALGYTLRRHQTDWLGRKWAFRTSPADGGGPTNYFRTADEVGRWCAQVEQLRGWYAEMDAATAAGSRL